MTSNRIHDEEAALVGRCRAGDLDAFEELVDRHQKKMLNIAYRIVGSYDDACEVVQDAFVSAYRNIKKFRGDARVSTWLYAIAVNLSRSRLKRTTAERSRTPYSIDSPGTPEERKGSIDPPSENPSALAMLEQKDVQVHVQECIRSLDRDFRAVVVLRDIEGFSYDEIADILNIAEGTVKSRLFRARDMLRECLRNVKGIL